MKARYAQRVMHTKSKAKHYRWEQKVKERIEATEEATSKLEETVKADVGWQFLDASESEILPKALAVSLSF